MLEEFLQRLSNIESIDMKLLINSLPKSGTNMVQKCLELASVPYSVKSVAASSVFGRYQLAKRIMRSPRFGEVPVPIGLEVPVTVSPRWVKSYLASANGYVSGHAAYSVHYDSLLQEKGYKVIQVVRHPCAVLSSWANYIAEPGYYWRLAHQYLAGKPFEERVKFILYGGNVGGDDSLYYRGFKEVLSQVQGWLDAVGVLTVRYEDIVGEMGGGDTEKQHQIIMDILQHIGVDAGSSLVQTISTKLYGGTHTFRKGSIGGWRNLIDSSLEDEIMTELADLPFMKRLNYSL